MPKFSIPEAPPFFPVSCRHQEEVEIGLAHMDGGIRKRNLPILYQATHVVVMEMGQQYVRYLIGRDANCPNAQSPP